MIRTKWNFQKPHANFAHYATAKRFAQQREAYSATPFAQAIVPTPSSILFTQTTSKIGTGLKKSGDFFFDLFEYRVYGPLAVNDMYVRKSPRQFLIRFPRFFERLRPLE